MPLGYLSNRCAGDLASETEKGKVEVDQSCKCAQRVDRSPTDHGREDRDGRARLFGKNSEAGPSTYKSQGRYTDTLPGNWVVGKRKRALGGWTISLLCVISIGYVVLTNIYVPRRRIDQSANTVESVWDVPWDTEYDGSQDGKWLPDRSKGYLDGLKPIQNDPNHILVPQNLQAPPPLLRPISGRLPSPILTDFYTTGKVEENRHGYDLSGVSTGPVDMVFLWVNASDPYFQQSMLVRAAEEGVEVEGGDGKRYRDNGELRGAMRSVKSSLHGLNTIHILSGDYHADDSSQETNGDTAQKALLAGSSVSHKMGQIPSWLDWDAVKDGISSVKWHFHSNIFRIPMDAYDTPEDRALDKEFEDEWREMSTPSYNSFAIESRVGWLEGLAENYILSNDDMFMLREMAPTDFHHPMLGDVIRADGSLLVKPRMTEELVSTAGEWGGLQHASQMISRRFPSFSRGYMYHIPKALTLSLTHEASVMWEDELTEAATRGFRRSERGIGDIEMSWLVGFLRVERWREALLWSWAVARMGGESGYWGEAERGELERVLDITTTEVDSVLIEKGERKTLVDILEIEKTMGWEHAKQTAYTFSSMDGIMLDRPGETADQCFFSLKKCLPADFFTTDSKQFLAEDMFARLAFAYPECGDCLVTALIKASGERGLEAILPHSEQTIVPEKRDRSRWERSEPMLPLTDVWQSANFSIYSVIRPDQDRWRGSTPPKDGKVNLKQWAIKLLSRYAYVVGDTPWQFTLIHNLKDLDSTLKDLDSEQDTALACFNDDQPDDGPDGVQEMFGDWMEKRWGHVEAPWERTTES